MTPDKLRERRRERIEKRRRALANDALAAAVEGMFRGPNAKEWLQGAAIAASLVAPILYLTL